MDDDVWVVVLVEGESDLAAVREAASGRGIDLVDEGIGLVAMGGATNVDKFVRQYGPSGVDVEIVGLCDFGDQWRFEAVLDHDDVFVCDSDLEDELIRALGVDDMVHFIEGQGEIKTFRTFQKQPAQRDRTTLQHVHRFCGVRAGRKARYAAGMSKLLAPDHTPDPLQALLRRIS